MSIESAQAFYSRITTDEAFRTQLQQAATQEERTSILQAGSYDFTQEEWAAVTAQNQTSTAGELSDEELTLVSGGLSIVPIAPTAAYGSPMPSFPLDPSGNPILPELPE